MDIAAWLHGLALERYEAAFRDNDVDEEVLPEPRADDLVSIGVASVGHRRKLLAAIAALGAEIRTAAVTAVVRDTHVYNWFTEGFETQDLKEAKALLDELQ